VRCDYNHPHTATKPDNLHKITYHPYTLTLHRVPMINRHRHGDIGKRHTPAPDTRQGLDNFVSKTSTLAFFHACYLIQYKRWHINEFYSRICLC